MAWAALCVWYSRLDRALMCQKATLMFAPSSHPELVRWCRILQSRIPAAALYPLDPRAQNEAQSWLLHACVHVHVVLTQLDLQRCTETLADQNRLNMFLSVTELEAPAENLQIELEKMPSHGSLEGLSAARTRSDSFGVQNRPSQSRFFMSEQPHNPENICLFSKSYISVIFIAHLSSQEKLFFGLKAQKQAVTLR